MHGVDGHMTLFMASGIIYGMLFTIQFTVYEKTWPSLFVEFGELGIQTDSSQSCVLQLPTECYPWYVGLGKVFTLSSCCVTHTHLL